jgi:NAD(P)-dependent dehydrogenase (short-subunit alcohol dehydrogenase family)
MSSSLFSLEGKIAAVLGGTSGLGHTIALGLADAGADVVVSARRQDLVDKTASEIESKNRKTLRVVADVRDRESLVNARESILKEFGRVDILVNAAGVTRKLPTLEMKEADWNEILETNLTGTLRGCQIFGELMLKQKAGRIINIASLGSLLGLFEVAAYSASKSGVASLTKSLAVEWSRQGVLVNAIVPGVFRTDMNARLLEGTERGREFLLRTPMGRYGRADELIGAAVFLASAASGFVTGQLIAVDGGILASGVNQ